MEVSRSDEVRLAPPLCRSDVAARKIVELANAFEIVQDGRNQRPDAVSGEGDASGIQGRPRSRDREMLARAARERNIRSLQPGGEDLFA